MPVAPLPASMEPRPHERGKKEAREQTPRGEAASMEPRPHERGKPGKQPIPANSRRLQWSHVLTNVERFSLDSAGLT